MIAILMTIIHNLLIPLTDNKLSVKIIIILNKYTIKILNCQKIVMFILKDKFQIINKISPIKPNQNRNTTHKPISKENNTKTNQ